LSLISLIGLYAQIENFSITSPYLLFPCNSAPVGGNAFWYNVDMVPDTIKDTLGNPVGYDSVETVMAFYSLNNQSSWDSLPLSLMGSQYYETTWEGNQTLPSTGSGMYWFRAIDRDSQNFSMNSPKNTTDMWTPSDNLLAIAAIEGTGDIPDPSKTWLDLTDIWIGFSDTYLYSTLANVSGDWPWDGGFLGPWYGYGVAIINPVQFVQDTDWVYAIIRADAPLYVTSPGLYRIPVDSAETLEKIGDIDETTSGGRLYLRCQLSDLINDPYFGPYAGNLALAGATLRATLDGVEFYDGTQPTRYYLDIHTFDIGTNNEPLALEPSVNPPSGDTTTIFSFSGYYLDPDNHLPVARNLVVDDSPTTVGTPDHFYEDSSFFQMDLGPYTPGWHHFYFEFNDGQFTITSPLDSFYIEEPGIAEHKMEKIPDIMNYSSIIKKSGDINVYLDKPYTLSVYDSQGRLIQRESKQIPHSFGIQNLSQGTYFIILKSNSAVVKGKFVYLK